MKEKWCDVCVEIKDEVTVRPSSIGPISFAYCPDCMEKGLEPYGGMVGYVSSIGLYPDAINEEYRKEVQRILAGLDISEEKFIKDVRELIEDIEDTMF